jgi:hypothetical protein
LIIILALQSKSVVAPGAAASMAAHQPNADLTDEYEYVAIRRICFVDENWVEIALT